jgi:hypothetical protein
MDKNYFIPKHIGDKEVMKKEDTKEKIQGNKKGESSRVVALYYC